MKFLNKIHKELKVSLMAVLAFSAIAFVEKKQETRICQEVRIMINDNGTNYFLDKDDVYTLVTADQADFLIGSEYEKINLKEIENRIRANEYVNDAQAYADLRGHISVEVTLNIPMARFLIDGDKDKYLCLNGDIISTSEKYTSRVLLLSGDYLENFPDKNIKDDSVFAPYFNLTKFIYKDEFWKAQIAQMDIDRGGDIRLYPQVTKQFVEFGKPENIGKKFMKLKVFYKKILPYKGWNYYSRVNIEYKDQIICE